MQNKYRWDLTKWTEHMDDTEGSSVFKRVRAHYSCLHHTLHNSPPTYPALLSSAWEYIKMPENVLDRFQECGYIRNVTHSAYDRAPYRNRGTLLQPAIPTGQTGKQACGCMVHHSWGTVDCWTNPGKRLTIN